MEKPDFVVRMEEEFNVLSERIEKLQKFLKENTLTLDETILLEQQCNAMLLYSYFLNTRIKFYISKINFGEIK